MISKEKVWLKYYSEEALSIPFPTMSAYSYLKYSNRGRVKEVALHYYGKDIKFKQLFNDIDEIANSFSALGVKKGDIVSFVSVAVPECIASIYALNKIGAIANTIDPRMDTESIKRMVLESESKILVVIDVAFPKIKAIMDDIHQDKIVVQSAARSLPYLKKVAMNAKLKFQVKLNVEYSETVIDWDSFLQIGENTAAVEAPYDMDDVVAITYTGGTTGFPKGVMLTNRSMNAAAFNFKQAGLAVTPGEKFLGIIPIFTSYGMVCGMHMPLCYRTVLVPIPRFIPATFGKLVRQFRPNHMISTPAFYELMMNSKEVKNLDLSFLVTMGSGGDTMNEGLENKLVDFMVKHNIKYPLAQGYGMSEVSAAASFCVNDIYKRGSVGIPSVTTTISIFDPDTQKELDYNEIGEVCITGPSMMKGYFKRPEETAHVMRKHDDGLTWIHSGDLGYVDKDGFLFIVGRVKRMITRFDGHKVFPVNIESLVSEREDVHNCSVIGVRDREHMQGHYPMVFVEFANVEDKEAVCKEIYQICLEKLEERGQPVAVVPIDKVPITGAGKNDYRALEKEYVNFDYLAWQAKL